MKSHRFVSLLCGAAFMAGVGAWTAADAAPPAGKCSRSDLSTVIVDGEGEGDVTITGATLAGGQEPTATGSPFASVRVVRGIGTLSSGLLIRGDVFTLAPSCSALNYVIEVYASPTDAAPIGFVSAMGDGTQNPLHADEDNALFIRNVPTTADPYNIYVKFKTINPATGATLDQLPQPGGVTHYTFNEGDGGGLSFRR